MLLIIPMNIYSVLKVTANVQYRKNMELPQIGFKGLNHFYLKIPMQVRGAALTKVK